MTDFRKFRKHLHPFLIKAEGYRKKQLLFQKGYSLLLAVFICFILALPFIAHWGIIKFNSWAGNHTGGNSLDRPQKIMISYWLIILVFIILSNFYKSKFKRQESILLEVFFKNILPNFNYNAHKQIPINSIEESKLLPTYLSITKKQGKIRSQNLGFGTISGKIGNTKIALGNVRVFNNGIYNSLFMYIPIFPHLYMAYSFIRNLLSKDRSNKDFGSNFVGLFGVIEFNKNIKGHTIILPDVLEKRIGYLAKNFQGLNFSRDKLINLEDPVFESNFVVYSTDQIEARYILTPSLMERITSFRKKINKPIIISFSKDTLYLAIPQPYELISLNKSKSLLSPGFFEKLEDEITKTIGIVKDLNLNTRIWKRESFTKSI